MPNTEILDAAKPYVPVDELKKNKKVLNHTLNHIRLKFETSDISYIIVKNKTEIEEIAKFIRNEFSNRCTMRDIEVLLTRIITTEQIRDDF